MSEDKQQGEERPEKLIAFVQLKQEAWELQHRPIGLGTPAGMQVSAVRRQLCRLAARYFG
jgi:hypothetical protein